MMENHRIRRGPVNTPYTIVANAIINHPTLSAEARLAVIYLISKPADWELMAFDLRRVLGRGGKPCGRDKAYQVIRELKDARYITARTVMVDGRFGGVEYVVHDEPTEAPLPENPEASPLPEIPDTENTESTKERKIQNTDRKKIRPALDRGCRLPEDFQPDLAWAIGEGMSSSDVARERERFADHWTAAHGPRGLKRDWQATWRNWVRNALDRRPVPRRTAPADRQQDGLFAIAGIVLAQPALSNGGGDVIDHK